MRPPWEHPEKRENQNHDQYSSSHCFAPFLSSPRNIPHGRSLVRGRQRVRRYIEMQSQCCERCSCHALCWIRFCASDPGCIHICRLCSFPACTGFLTQASRCCVYWAADGLARNDKFHSPVLLPTSRVVVGGDWQAITEASGRNRT